MPASDSSAATKTKKKGGGFLSRQVAKSKKDTLTEEQLLKKDTVSVEDVLRLDSATESINFINTILFCCLVTCLVFVVAYNIISYYCC